MSTCFNAGQLHRCMAADIISEFAFGQSFNLIEESPDSFKTRVLECMNIATRTVVELYHNDGQRLATHLLPRSWVGAFDPTIKALAELLGVRTCQPFRVSSENLQRSRPIDCTCPLHRSPRNAFEHTKSAPQPHPIPLFSTIFRPYRQTYRQTRPWKFSSRARTPLLSPSLWHYSISCATKTSGIN